VKQSSVRAWIASPCGFAMTGWQASCMNRPVSCSLC
jgi:hypothetical protein